VVAKVIFFAAAVLIAVVSAVLVGGVMTVAGYLAGMAAGELVALFASTSIAVFGTVIALACMAGSLFFTGSAESKSSRCHEEDGTLPARHRSRAKDN
jgi:hypothetical protein